MKKAKETKMKLKVLKADIWARIKKKIELCVNIHRLHAP